MKQILTIFNLVQEDLEDAEMALQMVADGMIELKSKKSSIVELKELRKQIEGRIRLIKKAYLNIVSDYGGTERDIAINALSGNLILN